MWRTLVQGAVIGVANIIPGVSGGTMALVLGIYHRVLEAVRSVGPETARVIWQARRLDAPARAAWRTEWRRCDGAFLTRLGVGAAVAVYGLAALVTWLLTAWHDPTYGFFFGLVAVSVIPPFRLIRRRTWGVWLAFLLAVAGVVGLSTGVSDETAIERARVKQAAAVGGGAAASQAGGPAELGRMAVYGVLGVSAMILPGVSGSLVLLLLGGYFDILRAIAARDLPLLLAFGAGCAVGLALFSRLLAVLLRRLPDITMGFLTGLVVGSLWPLWPFKHTVTVGAETLYLSNRWPAEWAAGEWLTGLAALAGAGLVAGLVALEARRGASGRDPVAG